MARLTPEQLEYIRTNPQRSARALAKELGSHRATVTKARENFGENISPPAAHAPVEIYLDPATLPPRRPSDPDISDASYAEAVLWLHENGYGDWLIRIWTPPLHFSPHIGRAAVLLHVADKKLQPPHTPPTIQALTEARIPLPAEPLPSAPAVTSPGTPSELLLAARAALGAHPVHPSNPYDRAYKPLLASTDTVGGTVA